MSHDRTQKPGKQGVLDFDAEIKKRQLKFNFLKWILPGKIKRRVKHYKFYDH